MPRRRDIILVLAAVAFVLAAGFAVAWAMGRPEVAKHVWHVLHLLIAFKALKWIAVGCLLAVLAIGRLVKSKNRETPANPSRAAVIRLPGCTPAE